MSEYPNQLFDRPDESQSQHPDLELRRVKTRHTVRRLQTIFDYDLHERPLTTDNF